MKKLLVKYFIVVYSVIISYLVVCDTLYAPLLALLFLSPLLLIRVKYNKKDLPPFLLILTILTTGITHPESFRLSTVGYSILFILSYICYTKYLPGSGLQVREMIQLIKIIIIAYAIVLIIQEICVFFGLPVFNEPFHNDNWNSKYKLNSLSYEPSHTGPVVSVLLYAYIKLSELMQRNRLSIEQLYRKDKLLISSYLYTMIFSLSVTCILSIFVLSLYFVRTKKILLASFIMTIAFMVFFAMETELGNRILSFLPAITSFDGQALYKLDPSSAARIGPYIVYIQEFDITSSNCWFGYGCDYGGLHLMRHLSGEDFEYNIGVGGIINFIYDYGLIAFFSFLYYLNKLCKLISFEFLLYVTLFSVCPFNVYMLWLFCIMVFSLKYYQHNHFRFIKQYGNINNNSNV